MPTPRISILLPVRDAAATLPACLRSLARQTLTDWECVLVDDGSRDESLAIARAFARRDPRLRVLARPRRGIVPSLRDAAEQARAPICARMDADDLMHRQRLAAQVAALDDAPALTAVGCRVRVFPRAALSDGMRRYETWLNGLVTPEAVARDAFVECPVAHPALAIRTEALRSVGYRDLPWPEDYDLVLRLLARGARITNLPQRLLLWRDGVSRLSRTDARYAQSSFVACKAAHLRSGFLRDARGYALWGYGSTGRALATALEAHDRRPSSIIDVHPRRIGKRIRGVPVLSPDALAEHDGTPLVVSVAGGAARAEIRAHLATHRFSEGRDYVIAA